MENQEAEITGEKLGQFKKGDDPRRNLDGRPKGVKNMTTKVKEALEKIAEGKDYTYEEAFVKSILKKAIVDGDGQIIKLIWNYMDGMPIQKTETKLEGNLDLRTVILPQRDIDKLNEQMDTNNSTTGSA